MAYVQGLDPALPVEGLLKDIRFDFGDSDDLILRGVKSNIRRLTFSVFFNVLILLLLHYDSALCLLSSNVLVSMFFNRDKKSCAEILYTSAVSDSTMAVSVRFDWSIIS